MTSVAGLLISISLSIVPADAGQLTFSRLSINTQTGDQFDPHVDADLAAYSSSTASEQAIHYFRFSTGVDSTVSPVLASGAIANDMLSDVQSGRIVFTRVITNDRSAVMVLDTAVGGAPVELNPQAGSSRMGVAVGGQTVAYVDFGLVSGAGEIMAVDLTTKATTRLTNDAVNDQNPAVSPDGKAIVWERCVSSIFNCDIYQAVKTATGWVVSPAVTLPGGEQDPDVSPTLVVYESDRGTGSGFDVIVKPLGGGAEKVIELPGDQMHASIAGDLVAFESRAPGAANSDIFVYDLASNRLFQITNSPLDNESLNDVTVLVTGQVRVVWDSNDENGVLRNVYGATFTLPTVVPVGPVCLNRSITLDATKLYHPDRWTDAVVALTSPMRFLLPATLPVIAGAPDEHTATLTLTAHGVSTVCTYKGSEGGEGENDDCQGHTDLGSAGGLEHLGNAPHPSHVAKAPATPAPPPAYAFQSCTGAGASLQPGNIVSTDHLALHVVGGEDDAGSTSVHLVLKEDCGTATASFKLERTEAEPAPMAGCSSTGAPIAPLMLLAALAFFALGRPQRRAEIRVPAEQERRRLGR